MDDFFNSKFLSKQKRFLSIKKINLEERPVIKKYLTKFFEDPNYFFLDKFKNHKIVLGDKKNEELKFEIPIPKQFHRKNFPKRKPSTKLQQSSLLNESKIIPRETSSTIKVERRRGYKDLMDALKDGRKYISDSQIEEIFNAFKKVHEINKNRGKDFITTKEFTDNNFINYMDENTINNNKNKNYVNSNTSRKTSNEQLINAINLKMSSKLVFNQKKLGIKKDKEIQNQKIFNNNNNSQSTTVINNNDDAFNTIDNHSINTKRFMKTAQSFFYKTNKNIKKRSLDFNTVNNLYEKQNQFLTSIKYDLGKKEMAKKLASQEKILLSKSKSQKQIKALNNYLSIKSKKKPADLLLETIEDYQELRNIKSKIHDLIKKRNPYENYNWSENLRIKSYKNIDQPKYKKSDENEIIINNKNKTLTNFFKGKNDYLKRKISKARYRSLMNNLVKTKKNLTGLEIKGQNLLKCEYDRIKKLKGKKVIINFNKKFINPLEFNNNIYAADFDFQKNVK